MIREVAVLRNRERLLVEFGDRMHFGCSQHWFRSDLRVFGGCGPVCALNVAMYLSCGGADSEGVGWQSGMLTDEEVQDCLDRYYDHFRPLEVPGWFSGTRQLHHAIPKTFGIYSIRKMKSRFRKMEEKAPFYPGAFTSRLEIKGFIHSRDIKKAREELVLWITARLKRDRPLCLLNTFSRSKLFVDKHAIPLENDKDEQRLFCEGLKAADLAMLQKVEFETHWVLLTGLYVDDSNGRYYLQCSSWGKVAYFQVDSLFHHRSILNLVFKGGILAF